MLQPTILRKDLVTETLRVKPTNGKRALDPFTAFAKKNGTKISLIEICADESRAEVHRTTIDFFYCLEGEVMFVTGGTLVDPFIREYEDGSKNEYEIRASRMYGGETVVLGSGDMIWIPNGLTHTNSAERQARLLIVKIPADEIYPLEEVLGWGDSK